MLNILVFSGLGYVGLHLIYKLIRNDKRFFIIVTIAMLLKQNFVGECVPVLDEIVCKQYEQKMQSLRSLYRNLKLVI